MDNYIEHVADRLLDALNLPPMFSKANPVRTSTATLNYSPHQPTVPVRADDCHRRPSNSGDSDLSHQSHSVRRHVRLGLVSTFSPFPYISHHTHKIHELQLHNGRLLMVSIGHRTVVRHEHSTDP